MCSNCEEIFIIRVEKTKNRVEPKFFRVKKTKNRVKPKSNRAEPKSNRAEPKINRAETDNFCAIKFFPYAIIIFLYAMKISGLRLSNIVCGIKEKSCRVCLQDCRLSKSFYLSLWSFVSSL